jgi:hypothetical protein
VPKDANNEEAERFDRYELVVARVVAHPELSLAALKQACPAVEPVFVTRVVQALEKGGYLQREDLQTGSSFRWMADPAEFSRREWIESKARRGGGLMLICMPSQETPFSASLLIPYFHVQFGKGPTGHLMRHGSHSKQPDLLRTGARQRGLWRIREPQDCADYRGYAVCPRGQGTSP